MSAYQGKKKKLIRNYIFGSARVPFSRDTGKSQMYIY